MNIISKKISEIKKELAELNEIDIQLFIDKYKNDERAGVRNIVESAYKRKAAYDKEKERTSKMYELERKYVTSGFICGIDEVGRGPLAGPVCAGACILPKNKELLYLNDSKQLSEKRREELYNIIMEEKVAAACAFVSPERIDEINILKATFEAMSFAVEKVMDQLKEKGGFQEIAALFIDAVHVPQLERFKQFSIIKGDAKCASIAAASIIAKVERDRLMEEYDKKYPEYFFSSNKGYGSKDHIEALRKYGATPIHRRSFIKGILENNG